MIMEYPNWKGHILHYRGTVDAAGATNLRHTNNDGSVAILTAEISNGQVTGIMRRGPCLWDLTPSTSGLRAKRALGSLFGVKSTRPCHYRRSVWGSKAQSLTIIGCGKQCLNGEFPRELPLGTAAAIAADVKPIRVSFV